MGKFQTLKSIESKQLKIGNDPAYEYKTVFLNNQFMKMYWILTESILKCVNITVLMFFSLYFILYGSGVNW